MRLIATICLLWILLASCLSTNFERSSLPPPELAANESVFISLPDEGRYGERVYAGSGLSTSPAFAAAFAKRGVKVERGTAFEAQSVSESRARALGCRYCVVPMITHWEDRATEWSGLSDELEIQVRLLDTSTGHLLDSATITGSSTFFTLGGDHPQDLLAAPVGKYVDSLY